MPAVFSKVVCAKRYRLQKPSQSPAKVRLGAARCRSGSKELPTACIFYFGGPE
jgi:hypothetical protein